MAGLVNASRVYSTCVTQQCGPRASPRSDVIHVLVAARKTWMRGTSPRMTDTNERNPLRYRLPGLVDHKYATQRGQGWRQPIPARSLTGPTVLSKRMVMRASRR
jgi:hypothetical protein